MSASINQDQDHNDHAIENVKHPPVNDHDAATKKYVDDNAGPGGSAAWGDITGTLSDQTDLQTALDGKIDDNTPVTPATKTKITFDADGLVTAAADATTADINDSTNRRYVTDAQQTVIGNTSGTNTGDQTITLTGDVTGTGTGSFAATVANDAVTYAKQQNVSAASKLLGRGDSGSGDPEEITLGTNLAMSGTTLNATAGGSGTVTTTGSPATGNLAKFSGATSITNANLSGDVTTSGTEAATIANDAVTYAKMQNVSAASKLLGRGSASGSGDPEEITLGGGLSMSGATINASAGPAFSDAPNSTIAINVLTGAPVDIVTKSLTYSANDQVTIRAWGTILNNSGGTKTYSVKFNLGSLTATGVFATTIAANATNRTPVYIEVTFGIKATNSAWVVGRVLSGTAAALGTSGIPILNLCPMVSAQTSSDVTGAQTTNIQMFSSANTATQSFELTAWTIHKSPLDNTGGAGGGIVTSKVSGSDFTTSNASLTNITGLTFAASANTSYRIEARLRASSSDTNGLQVALAFSAAGASGRWIATGTLASTTAASSSAAFGTASSTFLTGGTPLQGTISLSAIFAVAANPGNITVQILKVSAGTATVFIGSMLEVTAL